MKLSTFHKKLQQVQLNCSVKMMSALNPTRYNTNLIQFQIRNIEIMIGSHLDNLRRWLWGFIKKRLRSIG